MSKRRLSGTQNNEISSPKLQRLDHHDLDDRLAALLNVDLSLLIADVRRLHKEGRLIGSPGLDNFSFSLAIQEYKRFLELKIVHDDFIPC